MSKIEIVKLNWDSERSCLRRINGVEGVIYTFIKHYHASAIIELYVMKKVKEKYPGELISDIIKELNLIEIPSKDNNDVIEYFSYDYVIDQRYRLEKQIKEFKWKLHNYNHIIAKCEIIARNKKKQ